MPETVAAAAPAALQREDAPRAQHRAPYGGRLIHEAPFLEFLEGWMRYLFGTGQVPDDILEAMPEVSRSP